MTTAFQPGPPATALPTTETPPKRGPGRPKGSTTRTTRSLQPQIASLLMTFNFAMYVVPGLANDRLDEMEITALAKALDEQAKQSVRFRRMLEGALTATSGGQLLGIVAIIGMRRASRHGLLPPEADGQLGAMLAMQQAMPQPVPFGVQNPESNSGTAAA